MTSRKIRARVLGATCCAALVVGCTFFAQAENIPRRSVRSAFTGALPPMAGGKLKASIAEVTFGPSGFSAPHTHVCPVIGYVVEGSVRMQIKGQPESVYGAGETFYEAPNGIHQVSANASDKVPARFVAFSVCDGDQPVSLPLPDAESDKKGKR